MKIAVLLEERSRRYLAQFLGQRSEGTAVVTIRRRGDVEVETSDGAMVSVRGEARADEDVNASVVAAVELVALSYGLGGSVDGLTAIAYDVEHPEHLLVGRTKIRRTDVNVIPTQLLREFVADIESIEEPQVTPDMLRGRSRAYDQMGMYINRDNLAVVAAEVGLRSTEAHPGLEDVTGGLVVGRHDFLTCLARALIAEAHPWARGFSRVLEWSVRNTDENGEEAYDGLDDLCDELDDVAMSVDTAGLDMDLDSLRF